MRIGPPATAASTCWRVQAMHFDPPAAAPAAPPAGEYQKLATGASLTAVGGASTTGTSLGSSRTGVLEGETLSGSEPAWREWRGQRQTTR